MCFRAWGGRAPLQAQGLWIEQEGYIRHFTYKVQFMSGSSLTWMLNRTEKLNLTRFVLFSLKFFLYTSFGGLRRAAPRELSFLLRINNGLMGWHRQSNIFTCRINFKCITKGLISNHEILKYCNLENVFFVETLATPWNYNLMIVNNCN